MTFGLSLAQIVLYAVQYHHQSIYMTFGLSLAQIVLYAVQYHHHGQKIELYLYF